MKNRPARIPAIKPKSPIMALRSPPAMRRSMRKGQPKKMSAPIIMAAPSAKRVRGAEPPLMLAAPSLFLKEDLGMRLASVRAKAPRITPMTSGRAYCSRVLWCRPRAPAMSRMKQAAHMPMLPGFPSAVSVSAATAMRAPVRERAMSCEYFVLLLFFTSLSLANLISIIDSIY